MLRAHGLGNLVQSRNARDWTGLHRDAGRRGCRWDGRRNEILLLLSILIYYAWVFLGNGALSLGNGFRSRQHLRRQFDLATVNPSDADAHYQLGLIYQ